MSGSGHGAGLSRRMGRLLGLALGLGLMTGAMAEPSGDRAAPAGHADRWAAQGITTGHGTPAGLTRDDWSGMRSRIEADRYRVAEGVDGLRAVNPEQDFTAEFGADGFALASGAAGWRLPVTLAAYGSRGAMTAVAPARPRVRGERVEYVRGAVTEWYVNRPTGVEQGFDIARAPDGASSRRLELALAVGGGFEARRLGDGVLLHQAATGTEVRYDGLVVKDARGRTLPARMQVEDGRIVLSVDTTRAAWPIVVDPTFTQQAKLLAADAATNDLFGGSVSISGDTAVVGAIYQDSGASSDTGAAYVFTRSGGVWTQQAKLVAADGETFDDFGWSVSISGDTVLIGARSDSDQGIVDGAAYVFTRSGSVWTQQAKLQSGETNGNLFGHSVSLSGDTAVIGTPFRDAGPTGDTGAAYVFTRSGSIWLMQARLQAGDATAFDYLGWSVSVSGDTAVIGAYYADTGGNTNNGAAYVFIRSGTAWSQQTKLLAADPATNDYFGVAVSVSGDTAVVGAYQEDTGANTNNGAAYVFTRSGTVWTQQTKLLAADPATNDYFGFSVSLSGDTAVAGAYQEDTGANTDNGAAYVFTRSGGVWTQQDKLLATDAASGDQFGGSVSVSGDTVVVGARQEDTGATSDNGAAYVFVPAPVVVAVPTLSEWAMILFGLILAGGAAVHVQRRRLIA